MRLRTVILTFGVISPIIGLSVLIFEMFADKFGEYGWSLLSSFLACGIIISVPGVICSYFYFRLMNDVSGNLTRVGRWSMGLFLGFGISCVFCFFAAFLGYRQIALYFIGPILGVVSAIVCLVDSEKKMAHNKGA